MKELKSAISMLRARATMYNSLADALSRLSKPQPRAHAKRGGKRKISRAGRLAISRAQKKRWRAHRLANGAK